MRVTWNLSRHLKDYKRADTLIFSVGKSGRTWLRVLLNKYLSLHYRVPFGVGDLSEHNESIPRILIDHEIWSHYSDASLVDRLLGSNVVPQALLKQKDIVVVYRDPRDVVVSLYFHKTKRSRRRMAIDISAFVRDSRYGVANIVKVMNLWRERLMDHPRCHWIRYENLRADAKAELHRLLSFLDLEDIDDQAVESAVAFADFENMQQMEAKDAFGSAILRARNPDDVDSYKVREGKVGGYRKHFDAEDLAFIDGQVAQLDAFYGYPPTN